MYRMYVFGVLIPLPPPPIPPSCTAMYRRYVFGALIPLLLAPHPRLMRLESAPKYEAMWYELVVKCTIKVTKALQQAIEVSVGAFVWIHVCSIPPHPPCPCRPFFIFSSLLNL